MEDYEAKRRKDQDRVTMVAVGIMFIVGLIILFKIMRDAKQSLGEKTSFTYQSQEED